MNRIPTVLRRRDLLLAGFGAAALAACGGGDLAGDAVPREQPAAADGHAFRMPPETAPQRAVMLASPTLDYKVGWSTLAVQAAMIRELVTTVDVAYLVNGPADADALRSTLLALGVAPETLDARIRFHEVPHADLWVRDYGGLFLTDGRGALEVVDFDFDGYGRAGAALPPLGADCRGRQPARQRRWAGRGRRVEHLRPQPGLEPQVGGGRAAARAGHPRRGVAAAGAGDRRAHGAADALRHRRRAGLQRRRQPRRRDDRLRRRAHGAAARSDARRPRGGRGGRRRDGADHPRGVAARVRGAVVGEGREPADGSYGFIASLDHHPLHRLVGAETFAALQPVRYALAASYMNFVVANGVVLVPAFHKPGRDPALAAKDAAFKAIVEQHYPGRRVVQVDVDALIVAGGGMHCITQQIPA
jgi:hypothetical protein